MNQNKDSDFHYLLGLFETDGSFQILFKNDKTMTLNYRVFPVCVFTQKNTKILEHVFHILTYYGILSKRKYTIKKTSTLQIQGIINVKKFINLIKEKNCNFYGVKYIDFLYFTILYEIIEKNKHNTVNGRKQIIDLKYHMHCIIMQPFLLNKKSTNNFCGFMDENGSGLKRETWETNHNFPINSSLFAAQNFIKIAHKKYYAFHNKILIKIEQNTLNINPNFVSGVFEGDGSLSVSIPVINEKSVPKFQIRVNLFGDIYSEIFLRAIAFFFNDKNPYIKKLLNKNAFVYVLRKKQIEYFISHLKNYPIKASQGNLICFVFNVLKKNYNTNFNASRKIAQCVYNLSSDRKPRKNSFENVIQDFKYYYKN